MARLPQPGGDNGNWGTILNDFLTQALKGDGTIKDNAVTSSAIAPNAVTNASIASDAVNATSIADGSIINALLADNMIAETKLAPAVQTKLNASGGAADWNTLTNKPAVIAAGADQAAARTAIGAGTGSSNLALGTTSTTAKAGNYQPAAADISDATTIGRSILTAASAAAVKTSLSLTKSDVGLGNVDNTSDASKPVSTAQQTALDGKAALSHTHTASQISDASTVGKSLLIATDAAAARTAIGAGTSNLAIGTSSTTAKAGDYAPTKTDVGLGNVDNTSDATKLAANRADLSIATIPRLAPVVSKTSYGFTVSDGSVQSQTSRQWYDVGVDVVGVRFVYANFTGADVPNANAITIKGSADLTPAGTPADTTTTPQPMYFDGQRSVTIPPGGTVVSDVMPISLFAGKGFYCRTGVSVSKLGQVWPVGKFNDQGGGATIDRVSTGDLVDTATSSTISSTWLRCHSPVSIIGVTANRGILVIGDSIGAAEATSPVYADTRAGGFANRAFKGVAGVINISLGSERTEMFLAAGLQYRMQMARYCTDVIMEDGNNDIFTPSQVPTPAFDNVSARLQKIWQLCASYGLRVHAVTITPRTTSTDGWVTTGNQTTNASNALRVTVNNWIRAGAPQDSSGVAVAPGTPGSVPNPYIVTINELADAVETSRDSGIWKANYTGDGTHPNAAAHAAMAAAVNVSAIMVSSPKVGNGGIVAPSNNPLYGSSVSAKARSVLADTNAEPPAQFGPSDHGFISWAFDPINAGQTLVLPAAGTLQGNRLKIPVDTTITNIVLNIGTAGSGLTAGQCLAAVYQSGTLIGTTADQSTAWTSVGAKIMALTSPIQVSAGFIDVVYFYNGTTSPAFSRVSANTINYIGTVATIARFFVADTGRTTMPATLGTKTVSGTSFFTAVS